MKKIICSIILSLAILVNIPCAFAFEYAPYVGDGIIKVTSVTLKDAEGNEVTSLTPGEVVTASVRVNAGSNSLTGSEKVSFILASYSEGFLEKVDIDTKTVSSSLDFTASVTVPAIDPGIRVYLWDEIDGSINARPLFSMGETPAEASSIEQITIGGELIEDFSADKYEYDVTVNAGYTSWPEIIVFTGNTMTKVTAKYEGVFPLSDMDNQVIEANTTASGTSKTAVATITAGDKTYKINVTQEVPQITDVQLTYNNRATSVDEVWPEVKNISVFLSANIQNPKWTAELPGPNIESGTNMTDTRKEEYYNFLSDPEKSGASPAHANGKYHYVYNLSPELVGAHQIIIQRASSTAGPIIASNSDDYLTFTIDRSARIYAYVGNDASTLPANEGWTNVVNEIYNSSEKAVRSIYARYMGTSATAYSSYVIAPMRYLDVNVTPGETKTITIPKGKSIGYTFIKYNEGSDIVSNVSFKYGTTEANTKPMKLITPLLRDNTLTGTELYAKYKSSKSESSASTSDVPNEGTGNVLYGSSVFGNSAAYIPVSYDERFEGAQVLRLRTRMADLQNINFDLSAPAKVYILTNLTSEADLTAIKGCLDGWSIMGEGEDKLIDFYNGGTGNQISYVLAEKTSFEKSYYMDYGETKTITLDFSGMKFPDNKILMVLIQPLN